MIEKIIFNILAFSLFIIMFFRLIRKNDTSYVYALVLQFIGIAINFFELIAVRSFGIIIKVIMYLLSVVVPIIIIYVENKNDIDLFDLIYSWMAKFLIATGKYENAKKYLEHLLDKDEENVDAVEMLAKVYEKLGKYELALENYEYAYELDSNNYEMLLKTGEINNKMGNTQRSIDILSNLLKKKPEYYDASILLGNIYYNTESYKEATMVYMSALKYKPESYELNYYIGMSFTMLNDFNRAKDYYKKAANINSNLYHARFSIGQIELIAGEIDNAENEFMKCIDIEEIEAEAYYYIARISMIKGNVSKAKNYANISIEENPLMFERMVSENIFAPIIDELNRPKNSRINKGKMISQREKMIDEHLHDTTNIVGKLSNNDLEMIENIRKNRQENTLDNRERQ